MMTESTQGRDLAERMELIESMVLEGRNTTQYWGWMFLLWGVAYLVAIAWTLWLPGPNLAWPVTMIVASLGAWLGASRMRKSNPRTTASRALGSIWIGVGISIFVFAFCASISSHGNTHFILGGIGILLGLANFSSAFTLRWPAQFLIALVWWLAGASEFFAPESALLPIFAVATLVCQVGFGLYLMAQEARDRKRLAHA
jgi:hypothetical protein